LTNSLFSTLYIDVAKQIKMVGEKDKQQARGILLYRTGTIFVVFCCGDARFLLADIKV
jgi:hypothetical protein